MAKDRTIPTGERAKASEPRERSGARGPHERASRGAAAGEAHRKMMKVVPIRAAVPPAAKDADKATRTQLERVLTSVTFRQVDRLKRFLHFSVTEALAGRGDQLKEYVIGVQVFDKDSSFDPRADPIVRVQARRLRARLERYYRDEAGTDALVIELPKGGYTPVFKNRDAAGSSRCSLGTTLAGPNTIPVQPPADHTPAKELRYFCEGLRQEIIHSLAKAESLRVFPGHPAGGPGTGGGHQYAGQVAGLLTGAGGTSGDRV